MNKDIFCKQHRLIHGDALEEMDRLISEGVKVDAIICDPTFGITQRKNDIILNFEEMWKRLLLLRRNINTPIILFSNGMNTAELMISNKKMWKYNWVWDKILPSGMLNANRMPLTDYDDIQVFNEEDNSNIDPYLSVFYSKQSVYNKQMKDGNPEHGRGNINGKEFKGEENNYGDYKICTDNKGRTKKNPTRIIRLSKDHPSIVIHSQQKPVSLGEYLVKTYTNEGDTVLDFMMGSGFIIKACDNSKRNGIGIDSGYCKKKKFKEYYNKPWNQIVNYIILNK